MIYEEKIVKEFKSIFDSHIEYGMKHALENDNCILNKSYEFDLSEQLSEDLKIFTNKAKEYLNKESMSYDDRYGMIELWRYTCGSGVVEPALSHHIDDFGTLSYEVNTVIFYLQKTVSGGQLEILEGEYDIRKSLDEFKLSKVLDVKPADGCMKVLVMRGNVIHRIQPMKGPGIRDCVVVQFKRV